MKLTYSPIKMALVLGLLVALFLGSVSFSFYAINSLIASAAHRGHTYNVIENTEVLMTMLLDCETGQRGYVLTGEDSYLAPYLETKDRIRQQRELVKQLAVTNSLPEEDFQALFDLIDMKLEELEKTITARKTKGFDAALVIIKTRRGKELMDQIRDKIGNIKEAEVRILTKREDSVINGGKYVLYGIILDSVVSMAIVLFFAWRFVADYNAQKLIKEVIEKSESKLRSINESIQDAIIISDQDGIIHSFNHSANGLFQYNSEEMEGKPLTILMPDRFKEPHVEGIKRLKATGESKVLGIPMDLVGKKKDGTEFPIELRITKWQSNGSSYFTGIVRDVTEKKIADEMLKQSEERFRLIIENIKDYAIYMLDLKGHIVTWNKAAEKMKGYSANDILGKHFSILYTDEDVKAKKPEHDLDEVLKKGFLEDTSWKKHRNGKLLWMNSIITTLYDPEGNLRGFAKITRDITEQKVNQENLIKSYNELEQFAYIASHDLQEPLRTIAGFLQLLESRYSGKLDKDGHEFIQYAVDGAKRMQSLISDLLSYSRIGRKQEFSSVDMNGVIKNVTNSLQKQIEDNKPTFKVAKLPVVWGDATQLGLLMQNLISNSIKFHSDRPIEIEIGYKLENGHNLFWVKDNGIGIDPKFMPKLFQVFQKFHGRDKYEGTGIGLAICKKIVDQHKGKIYAESKVGEGATFFFSIPLKEKK